MRNILFIVTVQFITCSLMAQHNLTDGLESKYVKPDERAEAPIEFTSQKPVYKYNPFAHLSFANLSFEPFTIQYRQAFHGPIERYSLHFEEQPKVPQNKYVFVNGKVHFYDEKGNLESYSAQTEKSKITASASSNQPDAEAKREFMATQTAVSDDLFSYFDFYRSMQLESDVSLRMRYYQMMQDYSGLFCRMVQEELLKNNPASVEELLLMLQANSHCLNTGQIVSLLNENGIGWK